MLAASSALKSLGIGPAVLAMLSIGSMMGGIESVAGYSSVSE